MLSPTELITHSCLLVCIEYVVAWRVVLRELVLYLSFVLMYPRNKNMKRLYRRLSGVLHLVTISLFRILLSFEYVHSLKNNILASTDSPTASNGSTIGTTWLNFCVRNGYRCTPRVINTKMLSSRTTKYRTIS